MPFVQAKFTLPTVTRADGSLGRSSLGRSLGGYIQYNSNPQGDRYIWPAERIAIYQAQQAAKMQAAKKKKIFSLFDIFAGSPAPAAAPAHANARPGKKGVQTSAVLKGLADPIDQPSTSPSSTPAKVGQIASAALAIAAGLKQATQSTANIKPPQQESSIIPTVPNAALYIGGGLIGLGILVGLAKGLRR